ncbi:MAG: energy-coupling factor transporter transmembrane protein EcfT [Kouleothrix sp.]|nr:energy-coupling factor transporter transmembrane protein EcfT [Kouleothrix sp.]
MNTLAWLAWLLAALVVTGLTTNPLYLLLALLAATLVFLACHRDTPLARAYRLFFLGGLALWVGYVVFSVVTVGGARGGTVVLRLPALTLPALLGGVTLGGAVTAEDLTWGAVRGLRLWTLMATFGAFNALVSHYRLLRLAPRSFFHAGLAVTIAVSFVPQTVRAIGEIAESQRLRGHRFRGPRSYLPLVAPLLASSLEKSIQLAEALDARGYGRTRDLDVRLGRRQAAMIAGLLLLGGGLFGWLYYGPRAAAPALGLLGAGVAVLGLALRSLGRLVARTTYRRERWRRRDSAVLAAAIVCAAGWVALWLAGGPLIYNPYPVVALPPFDPLAGALAALLATPALFGPAPNEERAARPRRAPRRTTEPADAPARRATGRQLASGVRAPDQAERS